MCSLRVVMCVLGLSLSIAHAAAALATPLRARVYERHAAATLEQGTMFSNVEVSGL
jgi:hypothetical protein